MRKSSRKPSSRTGARGSRSARRANAESRRYDRFQAECGSISEARERALSEARPCPVCGRLVHPTNFEAHMRIYHGGDTSPQALDTLIFSAVSL
jgi:hypothetical protein